jgi:uncharacterized protein YneF (UPF0154 family)
VIPVIVGILLGFLVNRWWAVVFPIAAAVLLGSAVSVLGVVTMSVASVAGVAVGIFVRRRFWDRRAQDRPPAA